MTTADDKDTPLDLREQITRIDQMLAQHDRDRAQILQLNADRDQKRQEFILAPWQLMLTAITTAISLMAAGAGLLAAGVALARLMS